MINLILTLIFLTVLTVIHEFSIGALGFSRHSVAVAPLLEEALKGGLIYLFYLFLSTSPKLGEKSKSKSYWFLLGGFIGLLFGLSETFVDYSPGIHRIVPILNHVFWTATVGGGICFFMLKQNRIFKFLGLMIPYFFVSIFHFAWNYYAYLDKIDKPEPIWGGISFVLTVGTLIAVWKFTKKVSENEKSNNNKPHINLEQVYHNWLKSIIKVTVFLLLFFIVFPIIFSFFVPFSIFFVIDFVVIGGWFVPQFFNKYPFFYEKFKFSLRGLVITQFIALFLVPFVLPILGLVDVYYYDLEISKIILGSFSDLLTIPFVSPFIAFSLPFLIKEAIYLKNKVQLVIPPVLRKTVRWVGRTEKHYRSQSWEKGMPILIDNGTDRPLAVSSVVLQAYISDYPIRFLKTHYGIWESKIHKEHTIKISRQNPIQPNSSEILVIPWGEIKKLLEKLPADSLGKTRLFIELSDEFAGKIYSSPEIESKRLFNDMVYYTHWIKQLPKLGIV